MRDARSEGGVDGALRVVSRLIALAGCTLVVVFIVGMLLKPVLPAGLPAGREGQVLRQIIFSIGLALAHVAVIVGLERSQWTLAGIGAKVWRPLGVLGAPVLGASASLVAGLSLIAVNVGSIVPRAAGSSAAYAWSVFGEVVVLTIVHSLVWHGYMFGLIEARWGRVWASVVTGVGFALALLWSHAMPPVTFFAMVALGLALGAVRARTGNVVAAWLAHLSYLWVALAAFHSSDPRFAQVVAPGYAFELQGSGSRSGETWGLIGSLAAGLVLAAMALVALRNPPERH